MAFSKAAEGPPPAYPFTLVEGEYRPVRESASKTEEATTPYPFRLQQGVYRPVRKGIPVIGMGEDAVIASAKILEKRVLRQKILLEMNLFEGEYQEELADRLLDVKTFGEMKEFFDEVTIKITPIILKGLRQFIEANLELLGTEHPFNDNALQTLMDILTDEKEVYSCIGRGGEGTVYRRSYESSPIPEKVPSSRSSSALFANDTALKILLNGDYTSESEEIMMARLPIGGVLTISCVKAVSAPNSRPETPLQLGLVMELGKQSVADYLRSEKTLGKRLAVVLQVAEKVIDLHLSGYVHRDLKPDNVIVLSDGSVKLIDLSFMRKIGEKIKLAPGTLIYSSAPETIIAQMNGEDGLSVHPSMDIWSIGIMHYEAVVGSIRSLGEGFAFMYKIGLGSYLPEMFPEKASKELWHAAQTSLSEASKQMQEENIEQLKEMIADLGLDDEDQAQMDLLKDGPFQEPSIESVVDSLVIADRYIEGWDEEPAQPRLLSYLEERSKFCEFMQRPLERITPEDLKVACKFLTTNAGRFISDYEDHFKKIESNLQDFLIRKSFEEYPALEAIAKRMVSIEPKDRGSVDRYVQEISKFLHEHPKLI